MATKSKRVAITLKRKLEIIECVENQPLKTKSNIAKQLGLAPSTLATILKNKEALKRQHADGAYNVSQKKRKRNIKHEPVDAALENWFRYARSENIPLNSAILIAKADEFAKSLGIQGWTCDQSWIQRWRDRHNIVYKTLCGEQDSVDEKAADKWVEDILKPTIKRYEPKDVFNLDETALFWRLLPDKTFCYKGEQCHGGKKSKERITVMLCTNMDGSEKLPLFAIGKFKKPRCFSGIHKLPVEYKANKKAWMTGDLFKEWLQGFDRSMVRQHRKVLLVMDNCPSHKIPHLEATEILFLPTNTTSKLQPCDVGIIKNFKVHYRSMKVIQLISHLDAGRTSDEYEFSLLDAICLLKRAWDKVLPSTTHNCFHKAGFIVDETESTHMESTDEHDTETNAQIEPLIQRLCDELDITPSDYFFVDDEVATTGPPVICLQSTLTPNMPGLIGASATECVGTSKEEDDDDCGNKKAKVSRETALQCVELLRSYCLQTECNDSVMGSVDLIADVLDNHRVTAFRQQTKITCFFRKSDDTDSTLTPNMPGLIGASATECVGTSKEEDDDDCGNKKAKVSRETVESPSLTDPPSPTSVESPSLTDPPSPTSVESSSLIDPLSPMSVESSSLIDPPSPTTAESSSLIDPLSIRDEDPTNAQEKGWISDANLASAKDEIFRTIRRHLDACKNIQDVIGVAKEYKTTVHNFPVSVGPTPTTVTIDEKSAHWMPDDTPPMTPMQIIGDGNCLVRCASQMAYGHEDNFEEMRVRVVIEIGVNFDAYLDDANLQQWFSCRDNLPKIYAQYSEYYKPKTDSQNLTQDQIRTMLERELLAAVRNYSFLGIWQLHAISNIFNCNILSIYPKFGGAVVRQHLHRWVSPFPKPSGSTQVPRVPWSEMAIMWSSSQAITVIEKEWRVNHFVVCIPRTP